MNLNLSGDPSGEDALLTSVTSMINSRRLLVFHYRVQDR